ncbi:MAG: SPFH domain-containing protein [Candidatus Fermentibacteraceae bacterium]|nr:SPFH domain-containing protein [Candidatus Fermentibacteraceae bacterium]MBN2608555.1 SPFH domain-containing protein [Candidatus Fermentibacteraceae bacterium]
MGLFGKKSKSGRLAPKEWQEIKWGISSPLMVRLSGGIGKVRAFGSFKCEVADAGLLAENGCDAGSSESLERFKHYLSDVVASSFRDVLGARSSGMTGEELQGSSEPLSRAALEGAVPKLAEKGVALVDLSVEKILNA